MFLEKARITGRNKWWMFLLSLFIVVIGVLIGQIPLAAVFLWEQAKGGLSAEELEKMGETLDLSAMGIGSNWSLILALLAFVVGLLALWLAVANIHKRPFRTLITPKRSINWKKILFSFSLWMGLSMLIELVFYFTDPQNYEWQFQPGRFAGLVLIAIFIFPLQTSFEELLFRGYGMQGLSLISRFRWIPLVVTSFAFGLMHYMNPEVQAFGEGITMAYYVGVGFFLGIVTLMDDSLELALGIHAATNIYSALFVTFDASALQTAALFRTKYIDMQSMLLAFFIAAIVFTVIVAKKFHWTDWSKVYGSVRRPDTELV